MSIRGSRPGGWWDSPVLTKLSDGRRRQALAILINQSAPVDEQDLAAQLVATEQERPLADVTKEEVEATRAELGHSHLPALDDVDLIVWNRTDATLATTDHPVLQDPRFRFLVEQQGDTWDEVIANLIVERRRIALTILEAHGEPMSESTLAREIAIREDDTNPSADQVEETMISLHHLHLPKLQAAGLVEYNPDDETAVYCDPPELDAFGLAFDRTRRHSPSYGG